MEEKTQCSNVIGRCETADCMCWLCGQPIFLTSEGIPFDPTLSNIIEPDECSPECEHVLPIMQAILILGGLYSQTIKVADKPFFNYLQKEVFPYEYKWSHSYCNNLKSDEMFIDSTGDILTEKIYQYLGKIYNKEGAIRKRILLNPDY